MALFLPADVAVWRVEVEFDKTHVRPKEPSAGNGRCQSHKEIGGPVNAMARGQMGETAPDSRQGA